MPLVPLHPLVRQFLQGSPLPMEVNGGPYFGSQGVHPVFNPADGSVLVEVSMAGAVDVAAAVEAAEAAFPAWAALSGAERAVHLRRLADALEAQAEPLAQLESLDVGKAITAARGFDIPFGIECFRYFAGIAERSVTDLPLEIAGMEARRHFSPYGTCGFIFPWNFPFTLMCWGIAPALAAGNTAVVKASEITPLSSLLLARIAREAGLPPGVLNLLVGTGPDAGQPIAEHPKVKRMSFTGSTRVGRQIGGLCGARLAPVKLELGGKGAALICADAEVATTAKKLAAALSLNTGQNCCMATRWFVHASLYEAFVDAVSAELAAVRIGPGLDEETQMGPLASAEHRDRVLRYYQQGTAAGARLLTPDDHPVMDGPGYFVRPHLLAGSDDNLCFQEEVFGPTAFVVSFRDEEEAVRRINAVPYGLANSIWTADLHRASRLATRLVAGNNWINAHNVFSYGLPYGGVNLSGVGGGVNSPEAFEDYRLATTIARPL
ncbi:MAG: aldehyde dehydrogenase family protein [Verrucomicrobiia bacterium]